MKKTIFIILCLILLPMYCNAASIEKNKNTSLVVDVGYVTDINTHGGCGCSYYFPGDRKEIGTKLIFSSDFGKEVWMNLNGKDVKLKLIKDSKHNMRKGGRFYEIYQHGNMKIKFDYLVTWTCESDAPNDDSCEVWYYDLNITFSQNGQHKTIKAKGECGC